MNTRTTLTNDRETTESGALSRPASATPLVDSLLERQRYKLMFCPPERLLQRTNADFNALENLARQMEGDRSVLRDALYRLMSCAGNISECTEDELVEAANDRMTDDETREEAAAFLEARAALRRTQQQHEAWLSMKKR